MPEAGVAMNTAAEVLLEQRGAAFWITINRPDKRNALHPGVIDGIREGLRRAHALTEVRVIVITGAGDKAFCAGGDLRPGQGFAFDFSRPRLDYGELLREAQDASLPIIARINGACMAGGVGLAAMGDFAIAADHAQFGLPEVRIGLFPMQVLSLLQTCTAEQTWQLCGHATRHGDESGSRHSRHGRHSRHSRRARSEAACSRAACSCRG